MVVQSVVGAIGIGQMAMSMVLDRHLEIFVFVLDLTKKNRSDGGHH